MTGRHASPACVVLANKRRLGENVDEKQVSMLSAPSRPHHSPVASSTCPPHHRPAAPCWWRIQRTCVYTCRDGARCLALDAAAAAAAGEHGLYHRQLHQLNDHLSRVTVCKTRLLTHIAMLNEVSWHYGSMNELLSSLRWSLSALSVVATIKALYKYILSFPFPFLYPFYYQLPSKSDLQPE